MGPPDLLRCSVRGCPGHLPGPMIDDYQVSAEQMRRWHENYAMEEGDAMRKRDWVQVAIVAGVLLAIAAGWWLSRLAL